MDTNYLFENKQIFDIPVLTDISQLNISGSNQKKILITTPLLEPTQTPSKDSAFMLNILKAVHLDIDDVLIIHIAPYQYISWGVLKSTYGFQKWINFGLPLSIFRFQTSYQPLYTYHQFMGVGILHSASLTHLQKSLKAKTALWKSLKKVFDI